MHGINNPAIFFPDDLPLAFHFVVFCLLEPHDHFGGTASRAAILYGGEFQDATGNAKALALSLEENDPAVQRVAMESLKTSTGKDYGMSVQTWREYLDGGNPRPPDPPSWAERLLQPWF